MADFWDELVAPPDAPTAHLSDSELVEVERIPGASKHLVDCTWCSTRRANIANEDTHAELETLLDQLAESAVPSSARDAASTWSLPEGLATWLNASVEETPKVVPGQLWRLSWHGHQTLAVVVDRKHWWMRMAPVTTDVELADEYSLVTGPDSCSLGLPTTVFLRAAATVPLFTLSQFLGDVTVDGSSSAGVLRELDRACIRGVEPPATAQTGARLAIDDWDRQEALDALQERMQWFEAASAELVEDEDAGATEEAVDVIELLSQVNDVVELSERSGVAATRLLDMLNRRAQPSSDERAALTQTLGTKVKNSLPEEAHIALIELVSEPAFRDARRKYNKRVEGVADVYSVVPLVMRILDSQVAARSVAGTTRDRDREDVAAWRTHWRDILAHVLADQA